MDECQTNRPIPNTVCLSVPNKTNGQQLCFNGHIAVKQKVTNHIDDTKTREIQIVHPTHTPFNDMYLA